MGPQLARLSLGFTSCALLFQSSPAFEPSLAACAATLVALGRQAGVAVAVLTSSSPAQTEARIILPMDYFMTEF